MKSGADPGFSRDEAKGERQPIIWPNFPENSMKIKKIGQREVARPQFYYVDPLLKIK